MIFIEPCNHDLCHARFNTSESEKELWNCMMDQMIAILWDLA